MAVQDMQVLEQPRGRGGDCLLVWHIELLAIRSAGHERRAHCVSGRRHDGTFQLLQSVHDWTSRHRVVSSLIIEQHISPLPSLQRP